ncbi:hypothetical protein [Halorubrum vacuolatum]|uniref:Uncharacterized protein n=1 Tax=Halorubrum vacuolatum TaxID=63740 RepID=A0A238UTF7_HALVU|nr:hypothetical protein [Halorubrum vacuolatum]SNR25211.1 hypothetical protein SAMN06264855_101341 [Halorubrum vacuolatum]
MKRTRRAVLGAGLVAGLAGCLGAEGVRYPDEYAGDAAVDAVDAPENDEAIDASADDGRDNEALAEATRRVVDDALWFATEYPEAVETYLEAVGGVVSEIDAVREAVEEDEAVDVEQAEGLEAVGMAAAETAGDALEPHFGPRGRIEQRTERHVTVLKEFARRDDVDRFLEEIDRMRRTFGGMATDAYVDEQFSRDPIHNRLLNRMLYPLPVDSDDRREVREGTLIELAVASEGLTTYVGLPYDDEFSREQRPRIYGSPIGGDRREEIRARFGPVVRPGDRTAELFVVFAERPQPDEDPDEVFEGWPEDLDGVPVYVQRYPDAETAADHLDAIAVDARTEDDEPIDPGVSRTEGPDAATHWHRIYHHEAQGERYAFDEHAGVQYGYVVRAGEFLLPTGFSGDAWEERAGWQGPLADGWVVT